MPSVVPHGLDGPRRTLPNRRTLVKGAAWAAPTLVVATTAPAMAVSPPGASGCYPSGTTFDAQARGRLVSGAIAGINLDSIAEVGGVHARAFSPAAPGALGSDHDRQANPLDVGVLGALQLNLGGLSGALSTILDFTLGQQAGVVNQYAEASSAAEEGGPGDIGASGAVSSNGTLELATNGAEPPALGTINLKSILEEATELPGVAELVGSVADLTLDVGAVGGRSAVDTLCVVPPSDVVDRDYALASLGLDIESNTVGGLLSAIPEEIPVSTDALWNIIDNIPGLGSVLSAIGRNLLSATISIDRTQLTDPIPATENPALQIALEEGRLMVDLAALLGDLYTGSVSEWLNSRGPNTRLFVDAGLPSNAISSFIETLTSTLLDRIKNALRIEVSGRSSLLGIEILNITGSLADFLDGTARVELVGLNLGQLLNPLLEGIGDLVEGLIDALFDDNGAVGIALDLVNDLLSVLFGVLTEVLAITLNAQNNTDSGTMPTYYQAIDNSGRFDAAALHLEVLGIANLLNLSLGRGVYGPKTARPETNPAKKLLPF